MNSKENFVKFRILSLNNQFNWQKFKFGHVCMVYISNNIDITIQPTDIIERFNCFIKVTIQSAILRKL